MNQNSSASQNSATQDQNIDPRVGNPFYKGDSTSNENTGNDQNNADLNNSNENEIQAEDIKITVEEEKNTENTDNNVEKVEENSEEKNKEDSDVSEIQDDENTEDVSEDLDEDEEEEIPVHEQLDEFLSRNLFLEPDLKQKILDADMTVQEEILPILSQMDEKQTDLFRKILEKNPHFFGDLENMAIRDALKKLVQREEQDHLREIADAENELENMLSGL